MFILTVSYTLILHVECQINRVWIFVFFPAEPLNPENHYSYNLAKLDNYWWWGAARFVAGRKLVAAIAATWRNLVTEHGDKWCRGFEWKYVV